MAHLAYALLAVGPRIVLELPGLRGEPVTWEQKTRVSDTFGVQVIIRGGFAFALTWNFDLVAKFISVAGLPAAYSDTTSW